MSSKSRYTPLPIRTPLEPFARSSLSQQAVHGHVKEQTFAPHVPLLLEVLPSTTYVSRREIESEVEIKGADSESVAIYSGNIALPIEIQEYSDLVRVAVLHKGMVIEGILLHMSDKEVAVRTDDGSTARTAYTSINYPSNYSTMKVRVLDESMKTSDKLELCYRTSDITWEPEIFISANLSELSSCENSSPGKLTLMADVKCDAEDMKMYENAEVIIVAQELPKRQQYFQERRGVQMSRVLSAAPRPMSDDKDEEGLKSDINYQMGKRTLLKRQKWILRSEEVLMDLVQYVPLNTWTFGFNQDNGHAERNVIFYSPFYLIDANTNLRISTEAGILRNTVKTGAYQEGELIRLSLCGSSMVSYSNSYERKQQSDKTDNGRTDVTGTVTIKTGAVTCVLFGLERGRNIHDVTPEPNEKLSSSQTWYWILKVQPGVDTTFKYSYVEA